MAQSMVDNDCSGSATLSHTPPPNQVNTTVVWPSRACTECKRKKTRCDMKRPSCSLCVRVGSECVFPTRRKRPEPRRLSSSKLDSKNRDQRWMQLVSGGVLDRLMQLIDTNVPQLEANGLGGSVSSASSDKSPGPVQQDAMMESPLINDKLEPLDSVRLTMATHPPPEWRIEDVNVQQDFDMTSEAWDLPDGFDQTLAGPDFLPDQTPTEDFVRFKQSALPQVPIPPPHEFRLFGLQSPGSQPDISPVSQTQDAGMPTAYTLIVSDPVVDHLVDVFFDRVTLPLFHKPRFYKQHLQPQKAEGERYRDLSLETAFILNGIMSLAARFSNSPHWSNTPPTSRGEIFAKQAQSIYADATRSEDDRAPCLAYLQGCILLAFYHQSNGPTAFGWTLIGVVTRLTYDLGLNNIDKDFDLSQTSEQEQWNSAEEWSSQEELRRAWWSAWELDTYASTVSHRPYSFSPNAIHVFLPVSDENWFASQPIASVPMGSTLTTAWKSLQSSANQDERAWFLVSNFMMRLACELSIQKEVSREAKWELDCALSCFSLSLPETFRATSGPLIFDDGTFRRSNWITATNIMLQSARTYATLTMSTDGNTTSYRLPHNIAMLTPEERLVTLQQCEQHANQIIRAINGWSPDYMAYSSPFIICALFGPACLHFLSHSQTEVGRMNRELVGLVFAQFSRYWNIGSRLLELMHRIGKLDVTSNSSFSPPDTEGIAKRFAGILPDKDISTTKTAPDFVSGPKSSFQSISMAA